MPSTNSSHQATTEDIEVISREDGSGIRGESLSSSRKETLLWRKKHNKVTQIYSHTH